MILRNFIAQTVGAGTHIGENHVVIALQRLYIVVSSTVEISSTKVFWSRLFPFDQTQD